MNTSDSIYRMLKKLLLLVTAVSFVVAAFTGFYQRLFHGEVISGWYMMLHVMAAPVFAVCVMLLGLVYACFNTLRPADAPWFIALVNWLIPGGVDTQAAVRKGALIRKVLFWLTLVSGLVVFLSIILSMLPLFGTEIQELLLAIHRYGAIVFSIVIILLAPASLGARERT